MHTPLTQKHPQHKQTPKEQKIHLSLVVREVKSIAQIALPMILAGLLLALAGGSLAFGFANITGYSILSGLAMGIEPICSQAFGAKKHALLGLSLQRTLLLLMLTSLPIFFLWLNMKRILLFCGQDEAIATEAQSFLLYTIPDLLALSILHLLRIYLRSQSITLPLTFCATLSILLHIPINLLLVTHLGLGIKGVALGGVWTNFNLVASLIIYILISGVHEKTLSVLGLLSSIRTSYTIFKKKSSDGYASTTYVVALFRASLLLYYGILKTNAMGITFNAIVIVTEIAFLVLFLIYASTKEKMYTVWLLLFNIGGFGATVALTMFLLKGQERINAVGWICMAFNLAAFAVPLSIMWRMIKTKSVEFMPFMSSLFPTLSAIAGFCNGLIVKDLKIALPNAVGFVIGLIQIIVYMIYKDGHKKTEETNERNNQQEVSLDMEKLTPIQTAKLHLPRVTEMDIFTSGKPIEPNDTV